jgi:hypothetical protein
MVFCLRFPDLLPVRLGPIERKIVHLSPIFVSSSRIAIGSELLHTAVGSR